MRTLIIAIAAVFSTGVSAQQCDWLADSGDKLVKIEAADWDYAYERQGVGAVNCVTVRTDERTTLACEDGTETEVFIGSLESAGVTSDVMSFDYQIFARHCV